MCLPSVQVLAQFAVLTQGPPTTAAWSGLLRALDAVGASPRLTLTSMSNGQELDIVTLESHVHLGEQGGLPGALRLIRHAVDGGCPLL